MARAYGETMAEYFAERFAPLRVQSAALENHIAVTHLRYDGPGTGLTDPVPAQPALLLAVQLKPLLKHDLWLDGQAVKVSPYAAGALTMLDLNCTPMANLASSYECVQMYFPRSALDALSDAEGVPRFGDVPVLNGAQDPVLAHLASIASHAVRPAGPGTPLLLDAMALAVHRHLHKQYLGRHHRAPPRRGVLAGWQERRAQEYIEAHLHKGIGLLELAQHCNLSPSHFGRAFKNSVGVTPHQWIMARRIARARALLQGPSTLTQIAQQCGFSDASHLARAFVKSEGVTTSAWRQQNGKDPVATI